MKTKIILCIAAYIIVCCCGCSWNTITEVHPDGSYVTYKADRALWYTNAGPIYIKTQQGTELTVGQITSHSDPNSVKAVTEGVTDAVIKAVAK